ncbi:hypothetical protein JZ751_027856 [Albula glossodonta]|uniref:PAS domain-containing protein n=1 Tax=Albula glossodonta TaxID=121402 RepID=A0A8T2P7E5_9TELE|nr:hypothetical protein JZ751_027856 [Albula glossodonta]
MVDIWVPEGELLLQALNGFVLVVTAEGIIFYSSHTIQDYLGFHQTDVMHQSVFELIHTEDQQEFRRNLHWALNPPSMFESEESPQDGEPVNGSSLVTYKPDQLPPENSSFLERSFVCRFRCLLDNSSGFLALSLQGRLKFLHGQNQRLDDGCQAPPQLALFAIATPLQPPSILEIRTKNMIFRTKHKLDFTPMACDAKGKIVLGYTEAELRVRGSGYQFIHAADMLHCAENHIRMIKTGESGLTVFRLLTKDNRWKWVQANARLVYKNGKPDYIIATQRPLAEEEGGEHLRKRSMHHPFTFATGEALLYQTSYPIPGFTDTLQGKSKSSKSKKGKSDRTFKDDLDPNSLLGALVRQDESVYVCQPALEPKLSFHSSLFNEQGECSEFPMSSAGETWSSVTNSDMAPKPEPSSFDPLLVTLDNLSLDSEENCSNSELFSALENLGLNAEDLELLLLDERMIRVEMDPEYIPSLNDLLTNNEILSYIHDSLDSRPAEGSSNRQVSCAPCPTPQIQASLGTTPCPGSTPLQYPLCRPHKQPPIVQLSQQMQEHLETQLDQERQDMWSHQGQPEVSQGSQPGALAPNKNGSPHGDPLTRPSQNGLKLWEEPPHNNHWATHNMQMNVGPEKHQLLFDGKAVENEHQQQWQQNHLLVQLQSQYHFTQTSLNGDISSINQQPVEDHQWKGFCDSQTGNRPPFPIRQAGVDTSQPHPPTAQNSALPHVDYSMGETPEIECLLNGSAQSDTGHYQGVVATTSAFQTLPPKMQQQQSHTAQISPSCFTEYPSQNTSLEQILGIGPPQQLHSLESYGMFTATLPPDATNSKMEASFILNGTSVAYTGGCVLPNGNSATPGDRPHSSPDVLPTLPDPQSSGFYL